MAGLARAVENAGAEARLEPPAIQRSPRDGPLPLSFAQRRLWFLDQLSPGSAVYNLPYPLNLQGQLDVAALEAALTELVRRHEALRTTFINLDGEPFQEIAPANAFPLQIVDLQGLEEPVRSAEAAARLAADAMRPFDLGRAPLFRVTLLRLAPERHALLLTMHHIVSDAWSMGVLLREMAALYEAFIAARPSPLPELPLQYPDFAVWQRQWLSGEVRSRQLDYWRQQLASAPAGLDLPTDFPRPASQTFNGATRSAELPAELSAAFQALCRREGVTPFMLLLAAFDVLLARYSGQTDVLVGSPIANRNRAEIEGLIGFFVNTLVLRSDLSAAASFRDLLRQVRETALAAYEHQDLPFEMLVKELRPERELSRSPLLEVLLAIETLRDLPVLDHLELSRIEEVTATAKFDLSLTALESDSSFRLRLEYNTDLYEGPTIRRLLDHLERLLAAAVEEPERDWRDLPLLSAIESEQLLVGFNDTSSPTGPEICLHQLFAAQVARTPEALAVVAEEGALTYFELDERSSLLSQHLRQLGVGCEVLVGLCLERSLEMVVALLGVLKAGGAYVPLDPEYPAHRLAHMFADAGIQIVLTQRRLLSVLPQPWPSSVVCLDSDWPAIAAHRSAPTVQQLEPAGNSLAYVIFTSGSTGRPKGAAIPQRAIVNHMLWMQSEYPLQPGDRVLQKTPFSFDASVWEFYAPLIAGAALVIAKPGGHREPAYLAAAIQEHGVTILQTVPALLRALLDDGCLGECKTLRRVFCGGEALTPDLQRDFFAVLTAELINLYGPTETTVEITSWRCRAEGLDRPALLGRPIANSRIHVLNPRGELCPYGVPGEICIGGLPVGRGYLGRPEETAARFIPDRFGAEPGGRLYRTGDLGRWRPEGTLEFLGRIDQQVKMRGFRIELGEVEAALASHPAVAEAAVLADRQRLAAYVAVRAEAAPASGLELRDFLRQRLPDYMVPSLWQLLESLPHTPSGKVDRRSLSLLPAQAQVGSPAALATPNGPIEESLVGAWAELLGVRSVGIHDDFFDLGGHSLLATRVVSRVRQVFGIELTVRHVFERPTVAGLAASIEAALGAGGAREAPRIEPLPRGGPLPLSFAQRRLWFLDQLAPHSAVYNLPYRLDLEGDLDPLVLKQALGEVVRRHEALRTIFPSRDGEPYQAIVPAGSFPLPIVDLQGSEDPIRCRGAAALAEEEAARPFDLGAGPLFRMTLLRLGAEKHLLLLTMHHIVSDGWSQGILLRELSVLYKALAAGEPSPLPELPLQYADFAAWQWRWLTGEDLARQLAYWRQRLAGVPDLLELPADRPRPAVRSSRGDHLELNLPAELTHSLSDLAQCEGATLFMVLLAAFDALLFRYTGQEAFLVGSPIANRNREETAGLIGFFVNTLVLRADLAGGPHFRELLRRTREVTLEAYENQDLPFEKLVEELRPERSLSYTPLFQVMLVVQNAPEEALRLPGITVRSLPATSPTAKFDLTLIFEERDGGLAGLLEFATDLFDAPTAGRLARHFQALLAGAAARPEAPAGGLPLLTPAEVQQSVLEWNDCHAAYPREVCVHDLVAEWSERTPDAVALVAGEDSLSYRELDERAGRLARRLRAWGVTPDVRVAVMLERSADLVVALLAVLKAGGAFVPLDPGYPRERLAWLLEEVRPPVVIAEREALERLPAVPSRTLLLEPGWEEALPGAPAVSLEKPRALADNLAYVMFTSGTTGRPKGVAVPHRAIVRLVRHTNFARLDAGEALLLLAPVSFDASTLEIWGALANGGRLVIYPRRQPTLEELGEVLARHRVSTLWLTAGLFHQMVERNVQSLRPVRQLLAGGDVLSPQHVRAALEALPGCTVINGYGPTENTTFTCCHPMTDAAGLGESIPIGRPIASSRAVVVDRDFRPLPVGAPGELLAAGDGLARGYLDRPDLTAERFIPDPTAGLLGRPGERAYRTGDLVRLLPDGCFDFLGRIDQQVKIRGFRIEPAEIESALCCHPAVTAAVVTTSASRSGVASDRRLTAYVVAHPGPGAPTATALRAYLRERLPEPMIPTAWMFLEELPLTAHGKVDRRALPEPGTIRTEGAARPTAPRTPTEEVLAGLWCEVLEISDLDLHDNFFDLGGHSLLATQIVSRIRDAFGVELSLRRLFETPTVGGLAEGIDEALRGEAGVAAPRIEPMPRDRPLPLSFAQQRLWFLDQLSPNTAVYNIASRLSLAGELSPAVLERALGEVVRRHEALRTTFPSLGGEPSQAISPVRPFVLPLVDLGALPEQERGGEVARLAAAEGHRPFDLGTPPLFRTTLLRLDRRHHVLLLIMHHIVSDGWSMEILLRELTALYEAFAAGRPSPLPELPVQYADFAVWQRRWLSGETLTRQLEFWRRQLAGAPASLDLPTDFPRPPVQTFNGATCSAELPAGLEAFCRREGVTRFMLLLAAFDVLLCRYSGQQDVLIGSPVANRNRAEIEGLIGFFVNTLVLRTRLGEAASFRDLLRQVRETALAAYGHQDLPFETLVEELRPERDLSHSPFFQALLSEAVREDLPGPQGLGFSLTLGEAGTAKFDLSLFLDTSESAVAALVEYNTDLYEGATIRRLLGHLGRLLGAAVEAPERGWRDLPLLSAGERQQLLVGFDDTGATSGPELCLHELFEAQVRIGPEREAMVAPEGVRLSYGELNARAERLARRLRALGLGPEMLAGVLLDRTADLIITLLAVLKAGGAYAPLDPNYPQQRVLLMLETARARVLVTRRHLAEALGETGAETVLFDAGWEEEPVEESIERPAVLPDNLGYVIFTSGSTGVPKGVAIQHRSAVAMIRWAHTMYSPEEYAGMLVSTSICFDMSVFEIFATLAAGGRLILAENALALPELAAKEEVVLVDTVPSAMAELLRIGRLPRSIRTVNLGGEPLKATLVREIYDQLPSVERVVNLYGPSEDTTFTSYSVVPRDTRHPLIGRPLTGEAAYVLDGEMRPVPIGVPGALFMGGEGVTRGYLHRPELTAERYIPNLYGPPGSRLYTVGDLVRYLPTGELDFLGRLDHQVKVRGFRIELGEIESALVRHPQVREAAVLAEPEPGGAGNRLIAYVETDNASSELTRELRAFLKQSLPEYMVPSQFMLLSELPLTPNGKIDRRALAAMPQRSETTAAAEADRVPRSYAEEVLVGIWGEIFERPVGVEDNFFDLGGHSLLATRAASQVREAFGIELPVRRLFEQPTIAELAASIEAVLGTGAALEAPPIEPVPRGGSLPLSFAQRRLWFLDQLSSGSAVYSIPYPLSLEGRLDAAALEVALTEVVCRHEALRTTFPSFDGEPYQAIAPAALFPLPMVDLQGLEEPIRSAEVAALIRADAVRPFDLGAGPLFRTALLRLAPERHTLLLTMHHIVSDGWSIGVLLREITALYESFTAGGTSPLPELPVQYADFAVWQRQWLSGEALSRQLEYWRRQLAGSPAGLELPIDLPRPAVQTFNGAGCSAELPAELSADIQSFCRREGVTLFMLLLAAFDVLLASYSGQEDVLVGSPVANRNRAETEGLIGFFVNTLVLRANLGAAASFRDLLGQVRETTLAAQAHQDLPFELLVEELRPERDLSRPPLVQVLLALENASREPQPAGLRILPLEIDTATAKFELALSVREGEHHLSAFLEYNTDLFEEPTVRRIAAHLETVLRGMVADPEARIAELALLDESERRQLLARRELAAKRDTAEKAAAEDRAPRSYVEEVLVGIWSEILGHRVKVGDNFFDLGGHSLLATRVVSRIRSALDVELPLHQVFATPTLAGLAASIEEEIALRRGVPLPPIGRAFRDGELPLSFAQQRLWFLDRLEPGTPTFNLPAPLRLAGPLDVAALVGALAAIVERHESLRTIFAEREGRPRQIVLPADLKSLPVADLGELPVESREAEARRLVDEEARLPFDLTRGPLLRTTLLRLAADEHMLLVTMHHIVTDGWSTAVFARELAALYETRLAARPSPLPELPFQYPDFAIWQRRVLDADAIAALLARWKERLGTDLPVLHLPTDRPRPAVQTTPGGYRYALLPPDLTQGVRGLARASGTTLFMTLLAAFQALLARYTGQEKIVVGSPGAGRGRAELEGLIGFLVNTLVLPADLSGDPTFANLLERVRDMTLAAYACQDLPFEKLVEELQPQRDRGRSPLFQVMFSLQNASETAGGTAARLTLSPLPATNGTSQFDLTLAVAETPDRLWTVVEYNTDLFDGPTIERLLEHYRRLLAAAVADPEARLSALPPAPEELPQPVSEAAVPVRPQVPDVDARRDRLAARMSKLSAAQREALKRRLRGGGAA
ncbi:MAG TPA: amino acid adenylation domain-containing protein [Thermoanaerobaculia bacterium]|nr:amino acid adenylation domain-containing protein [Thermoanaerobaculia bacterium]